MAKTRHVLSKRHRLLRGKPPKSKKFYVRRVSANSLLRAHARAREKIANPPTQPIQRRFIVAVASLLV